MKKVWNVIGWVLLGCTFYLVFKTFMVYHPDKTDGFNRAVYDTGWLYPAMPLHNPIWMLINSVLIIALFLGAGYFFRKANKN